MKEDKELNMFQDCEEKIPQEERPLFVDKGKDESLRKHHAQQQGHSSDSVHKARKRQTPPNEPREGEDEADGQYTTASHAASQKNDIYIMRS